VTINFDELNIASHSPLFQMKRTKCAKCDQNRKYFCYKCFTVMGDSDLIPKVNLPLQVDIIHHPKEQRSKSTAIHARILAPENVSIFEFPEFPDYSQQTEHTLLLFPSPNAEFVEDMEDVTPFTKLIVVDSTWQRTKKILRDSKLQGLKCVKIRTQKTKFWRYQQFGDEYLATIEAIYYFLKEYHHKSRGCYNGEYDNLLYYYSYFFNLIQNHYKEGSRNFVRKQNYINYD